MTWTSPTETWLGQDAPRSWRSTLLILGVVAVAVIFSVLVWTHMHRWQTSALVAHRKRLPSCGQYLQPGSSAAKVAVSNRCLLDAFAAGTPAELRVDPADIEGHRSRRYYRVLGPNSMELLTENRSEGRVVAGRFTCRRLVADNNQWLSLQDCSTS